MSSDLLDVPEKQIRALLPASLALIALAIPWPTLLRIVETFCGQDLYIPQRMETNQKLRGTIGDDAMSILCREFGGTEFLVPKLAALRRFIRDQQIVADHADGRTINAIAAKHQLSARRVAGIIREGRNTAGARRGAKK